MPFRAFRIASATLLSAAGVVHAQVIDPLFAGSYTLHDLGPVPGVPSSYGGLTLKWDDPSTLIIGGQANSASGKLYSIRITRDIDGHIAGFCSGDAVVYAGAPYNDGGVVFGPGNVLFLARYPVNEFAQIKVGSTAADKVIAMAPFGVHTSTSSLNFVPAGLPGAGRMKLTTYNGGQWNEVNIAPDGNGTYDVVTVTQVPSSNLPGGPEGFTYVPPGSALFPNPSMLVSEYAAGVVSAFELNATGDPIIASRRVLVSGLSGAEGATIDPVTGDFLFSTFGGAGKVVVVRGFVPPQGCRADCEGDDDLDVFDYLCFLNFYSVQHPYANFDGDCDFDIFDFLSFQGAFATGC